MQEICYECCEKNPIAGYFTTGYFKYMKYEPEDKMNYFPLCQYCEFDFIISKSKDLQNFDKCDHCACYSEMKSKIHLFDVNVYKMLFNNRCYFFEYDKIKSELNFCIDCCFYFKKHKRSRNAND